MMDDDIFRLILQNQVALMNEASRFYREPSFTVQQQLARTEGVLAKTKYLDPQLRCARWPHCGCEGDKCGEVT